MREFMKTYSNFSVTQLLKGGWEPSSLTQWFFKKKEKLDNLVKYNMYYYQIVEFSYFLVFTCTNL